MFSINWTPAPMTYRSINPGNGAQRGAALMMMLVIMVMGVTTAFVTSLSGTALQNQRHQTTSNALALAKEALISYAVSDPNRPGELPCPDTDDDGSAESNCSVAGNTLVGRLPWRTLDLPDPRDSSGERLWYVVSDNFHANGSTAINSDTDGTISINSTAGFAAVVIAPGAALSSQNRPSSPSNLNVSTTYLQYLEDVTQTAIQTQAPNDIPSGAYTYSDQLLSLRPEDFMPLIEKRIAGEVKACLDSYALASSNYYPWASSVSDTSGYYGVKDKRFGRIAASRLNVLTNKTSYLSFMNKVDAVQIALNTYISNPTSANLNSLRDVGDTLKDASRPYSFPDYFPYFAYEYAHWAGYRADNLPSNPDSGDLNGVQSRLTSSYSAMASAGLIDGSMQANWTCPLLASSGTYWDSWKNQVFYQVSRRFDPGSSSSSCDTSTCLTINGSGNYRAVVALGRQMLASQNPRNPNTIDDYLEGENQLDKLGSPPTRVFETYPPSDPSFNTINDLVIGATAQ